MPVNTKMILKTALKNNTLNKNNLIRIRTETKDILEQFNNKKDNNTTKQRETPDKTKQNNKTI